MWELPPRPIKRGFASAIDEEDEAGADVVGVVVGVARLVLGHPVDVSIAVSEVAEQGVDDLGGSSPLERQCRSGNEWDTNAWWVPDHSPAWGGGGHIHPPTCRATNGRPVSPRFDEADDVDDSLFYFCRGHLGHEKDRCP